jgi:predicted DNA-binding transcriptional regulator YafY
MSTRLERIIFIDRAIRAGDCPTPAGLAAHFEVSPRTIYDDRTFMIDRLGAPIDFDAERGGWTYTDATYSLPALFVAEGDLLAFFLGHAVTEQYLGTPFEAPLRAALRRLARYLPDHVQVDAAAAARHYTIRAGARVEVNAQLLLDLERAIRERRQVRMRYYTASRGQHSERTVNPYHFYNARGDWYLVAHDHRRNAVRNFHLGRIEMWQVLAETFEPDAAFCAADFLDGGFLTEVGPPVDVAIRFDSYQARWIRERRWHATQTIEEQPDGGLILRLRCGGLDEIKRWVMSYGGHAEVLAPPELRAAVAAEVGRLAEVYLA